MPDDRQLSLHLSRRVASPPYQRHSQTSLQAAQSIAPSAETLRFAVLDYVRSCGDMGATDEEIQRATGINPSTQRPRRIELMRAGLVERAAFARKTASGRNASVWVAR